MRALMGCVLAVALVVAGTNAWVILTTRNNLHEVQDVTAFQADAIIVLGASVLPNGYPSDILCDRIDGAIALYNAGVAPNIIMSGDNGDASYNECRAMKNYAIARGVPSSDIFCDHAGFSTYDTMYRARTIFGCQRIAVSTQTYHLYRAIYTAESLDMTVVGVSTDYGNYVDQTYYDVREVGARTKDFFKALLKAPSRIEGEPISLDQSGDVTN